MGCCGVVGVLCRGDFAKIAGLDLAVLIRPALLRETESRFSGCSCSLSQLNCLCILANFA